MSAIVFDSLKQPLRKGDYVGYATANLSAPTIKPAIYLGFNFTKKGAVHRSLPFRIFTEAFTEDVDGSLKSFGFKIKALGNTKSLVKLCSKPTKEMEELEGLLVEEKIENKGW